MATHVAEKHSGFQFETHQSSSTDDGAESMVNSIGRNVPSKNKSTKQSNSGEDGKQHRAAAVAATVAPPDAVVTQTSGDETDYQPVHANLSKKKGFLDDDDDGAAVTSTPIGTAQNARSTARSRRAQWNDGAEATQNRRQTEIPTAHQLFDYSKNQSEFRASNFSNFGGGGAVENGGDGGKTRRPAYRRRPVSEQRAPVIPKNFEACPHCLSVMHQDYVRGHILRKHRAAVAYESSAEAERNGNNFITMAANVGDFCNGNGADGGVVAGKSKNIDEPNFTLCKLCSAHMHTDYMPLHLVRKHRTEFDGSVGFIWTECADDHVSQMLSSNRAYVKNGAIYFNDSE